MFFISDESRARLRTRQTSLSPAQVQSILKETGLRPTRQRLTIGRLLFREGHRHVTADSLHQEAIGNGAALSLATVYNALAQFAQVGLIRKVSLNGERSYFDTNACDHHHFYVDAEDRIIDIPSDEIRFDRLPSPPDGYEIINVDVVIRLSRAESKAKDNRLRSF